MSKRCCGIIYAEKDDVCFICGQPLKDNEEGAGIEKKDTSEEIRKANETENEGEGDSQLEDSDKKEETSADEFEAASAKASDELAFIPDKEEETSYKTNMALLSEIFDNKEEEKTEKKKKEKKKDDTPRGIKVGGVMSIIMAVLGLVVVLLCGYFMVFAPSYDKKGAAGKELVYPYAADESNAVLRESLLGTATDAEPLMPDEQGGESND